MAVDSLKHSILLGMAFRAGSALCWAVVAGLVKWTSEQGADVLQILFFRNAGALAVVTIFVLATAGPESLRTVRLPAHLRRALLGVAAIGLSFYSVTLMPLTEATAIGFTAPLFVTALSAPFLKERVTRTQWLAVLAGFAGVLVMIRPDPAHMASLGALIGLASALGSASATIAVRDLSRTERGPTIVFFFLLFATLLSALPLPFVWTQPSPGVWAGLAAIGLVSAGLQLLMTQSLRLAPAALVAPFDYTQMVWAGLIAWLVWNEQLRAATLVGGVVVVGSGLFILWTGSRHRASPSGKPAG